MRCGRLQVVITRMLFPLFILFSRKEKLIGVIDGMTQKGILRNPKKEILMYKAKEN
jgi:hypothetical protein